MASHLQASLHSLFQGDPPCPFPPRHSLQTLEQQSFEANQPWRHRCCCHFCSFSVSWLLGHQGVHHPHRVHHLDGSPHLLQVHHQDLQLALHGLPTSICMPRPHPPSTLRLL